MDNPLELPAPDDPILRVEHFARDLAWGAFYGSWEPPFAYSSQTRIWLPALGTLGQEDKLRNHVNTKWQGNTPSAHLLMTIGFLDETYDSKGNSRYKLTRQAFDLLKKPSMPPEAFISYRRGVSSAFALLLEARIRIAGGAHPFIDRNLVGGEDWHGRLKEKIEQAQYFICLIAPTTLESKWVQKEIGWAVEAKRTIIPVCHGGVRLNSLPSELQSTQGHEIKAAPLEESAADYDDTVNFVLGSMWLRNP